MTEGWGGSWADENGLLPDVAPEQETHPMDNTNAVLADKSQKLIELWFFRECNQGARKHLYALFGHPVEEITNHTTEQMVLRKIFARHRIAGQSASCDLGVGCDEAGVCYAKANGKPEMCHRSTKGHRT